MDGLDLKWLSPSPRTVRACWWPCEGSMKQERMANMEEFCGHELVISTRQHVFTHRDRAGQRGFINVTSEAQPEEGENPPAEVVMVELESTSSTSGCDSNDTAIRTPGEQEHAEVIALSATEPEPESLLGLDESGQGTSARDTVRESSALEVPLPHAVRALREEFPPMSRYVETAPWETLDDDTLEKTSTQSFLL